MSIWEILNMSELQDVMSVIARRISQHEDRQADFSYYLKHCKEIDRHLSEAPDIAIECCYTLIQGLCAVLYFRYSSESDEKAWGKLTLGGQLKKALSLLTFFSHKYEEQLRGGANTLADAIEKEREASSKRSESAFPLQDGTSKIVESIATLRNKRGILCHGRHLPREHISSEAQARFIAHFTQGIALLLLEGIHQRALEEALPDEEVKDYDDNREFNDWLDGQGEPIGGSSYSWLIYCHDRDSYDTQLDYFEQDT
jgi:hypothetical protein